MKILRRFRESVIKAKGVRKYMIYAIGEIILVVVGILIALWLNGRSENHKKELETHRTAELVWIQLAEDHKEISNVLTEWDDVTKTIDTILELTPKDAPIPASCKGCFSVLNGLQLPIISERISNLVERNPLQKGILEAKLFEIDMRYKQAVKASAMYDDIIFKQLTVNLEYLKEEYDWFASYISKGRCISQECTDYFQNSSDYRNRVAYFRFLVLEGYYGGLYEFMNQIDQDREELQQML